MEKLSQKCPGILGCTSPPVETALSILYVYYEGNNKKESLINSTSNLYKHSITSFSQMFIRISLQTNA